ncbi:MAG: hypothetical protein EOP06_20415 [Proteobacteria bacterium]|nr:MAG: hypothetical protein EOP06_20415 [Pseudomonadota bacterium]
MKRIVFAVSALALAGCEQTLPPTAEGLKLIAARTAKGTKNTKLETKTQPSPPLAGNVSIWDIKVYDIVDKSDGIRKEWKFFNDLPQSSADKTATGVLMNAWLISKDLSIFLPQKPAYKQYGSFLTDWTIPQPGPYTLWVEYQPVVARDELSFQDMKDKSKVLKIEHARWDLAVKGSGKARPLLPSPHGGAYAVYSLSASDYGKSVGMDVAFPESATVNQKTTFSTTDISGEVGTISDQAVTALSPDGKTLLHGVGTNPQLTFTQKGTWRVWFTYSVDGKPYGSPIDLTVK